MENKQHPNEISDNQSKEIKSVLNNEQIKTDARNTNLELVEKEKLRTALYNLLTPYKEKEGILQKEKDTLSLEIEKLYKQIELEKQKNSEKILEGADDKTKENLEEEISENITENTIIDNTNNPEDKTERDIVAEKEASIEVTKIKEDITNKLEGPEKVKVQEIIDEKFSEEDKKILQEQFPSENIEKLIESKVVEQLNDKSIKTAKERTKLSYFVTKAKKVATYFSILLVTATAFRAPSAFSGTDKASVISYNNLKFDNLKDFGNILLYENEINMRDNISIITKASEKSDDKYLVIDKQNGKCHRYQGDNLIESFNVCLGEKIGDEQTTLKSTYRRKAADDGSFHRREEVSIEEATYLQDGERYLKDGYEAFTDWGAGNMKTGAGIYTISNKGPFLGDKALFLKNERGEQVATSLHKNIHGNSKAFRLSNGCVGFEQECIRKLYKIMNLGEKVYILPDDPNNKFKIIDGELRFLSQQKDVNKTIRPYAPRPIIVKAENPSEPSKVFLMTIAENKEKLMDLYPTIPNDVYNEIAKLAYGIIGKESSFGEYGKIYGGQIGRVGDILKTVAGVETSVGIGQTKIGSIENKIKKTFNITRTDDLFNIKINAIATISSLLDNYLYISAHGREKDYKELVVLKHSRPAAVKQVINGDLKIEELGPKSKYYINKVFEYSKKVTVYSGEVSENYYASNWDYNQPNN